MHGEGIQKIRGSGRLMEPMWRQLKEDLRFLTEHLIMDYSLIVSFYKCSEGKAMRNQVKFEDGTYCALGIIDYLQEYNTIKKM